MNAPLRHNVLTTPFPDPAALRAAPMAELLHHPVSVAAHRLTDELLRLTLIGEAAHFGPRTRARTRRATEALKATIAALLRDLLRTTTNAASQGYCFLSERSPAFTGTLATYRQYEAVRDVWLLEGLLDRHEGKRHGLQFEKGVYTQATGKVAGWAPRLRATDKLLAIAADRGITPKTLNDDFERSWDQTYPVILRKKLDDGSHRVGKTKASQIVRYERVGESNHIAGEVRTLNQFLAFQTYAPSMSPQLVCHFQQDPNRPGQLVHGGRLYSAGKDSYQLWSKEERLGLQINGEPVAEIDIRASHLTIYLALLQVRLSEGADPYEVPGVPRPLVKRIVSRMFGKPQTPITRWPALKKDNPANDEERELRKGYKAKVTAERVLEAIPVLRQLPWSGLSWGELQKVEASMLRRTMTALYRQGIPALPIHDSLLVPESQVDTVAATLKAMFHEETGAEPALTVNRLGQAPVTWRDPEQDDSGSAWE